MPIVYDRNLLKISGSLVSFGGLKTNPKNLVNNVMAHRPTITGSPVGCMGSND
jgi:hypothetical protein